MHGRMDQTCTVVGFGGNLELPLNPKPKGFGVKAAHTEMERINSDELAREAKRLQPGTWFGLGFGFRSWGFRGLGLRGLGFRGPRFMA